MITLGSYLTVSAALFTIGFAGVLLRRNIIIIFMSL
ncbi:MAG: NADH-quinone oxidoreductase subunit K, partial [Chthoniobacterales bacterium]